MQGNSNHSILEKGRFLGRGILQGVALYAVTPYYPGAVRERGGAVRGEVYEVDMETLKVLDWIEDNGNLYRREMFHVYLDYSGERLETWAYLWLQEVNSNSFIPLEEQPWRG